MNRQKKSLGFKNPIGEILTTSEGSKLNIIGVVKDFHFKSLHSKIGPLIMHIGRVNQFLYQNETREDNFNC